MRGVSSRDKPPQRHAAALRCVVRQRLVMRLLLANRASVDAVGHLGERLLAVAARGTSWMRCVSTSSAVAHSSPTLTGVDAPRFTLLRGRCCRGVQFLFFNAQPTTEVTECLQASARRAAEKKEHANSPSLL